MTRRRVIIEATRERLRLITRANGYHTDGGLSVSLGDVPAPGPDDVDVALCLLVGDEEITTRNLGSTEVTVALDLQCAAVANAALDDPFMRVEHLLEDIKRAIDGDTEWYRQAAIDPAAPGGPAQTMGIDLMRGPTSAWERMEGGDAVAAAVSWTAHYHEIRSAP